MCICVLLLLLLFLFFIGEKSFNFYFFFRWCESQLRAEKRVSEFECISIAHIYTYIYIQELWSFTHNSDSARLIVVIRSPAELICAPPSARPALYIYFPPLLSLSPYSRLSAPRGRQRESAVLVPPQRAAAAAAADTTYHFFYLFQMRIIKKYETQLGYGHI